MGFDYYPVTRPTELEVLQLSRLPWYTSCSAPTGIGQAGKEPDSSGCQACQSRCQVKGNQILARCRGSLQQESSSAIQLHVDPEYPWHSCHHGTKSQLSESTPRAVCSLYSHDPIAPSPLSKGRRSSDYADDNAVSVPLRMPRSSTPNHGCAPRARQTFIEYRISRRN